MKYDYTEMKIKRVGEVMELTVDGEVIWETSNLVSLQHSHDIVGDICQHEFIMGWKSEE